MGFQEGLLGGPWAGAPRWGLPIAHTSILRPSRSIAPAQVGQALLSPKGRVPNPWLLNPWVLSSRNQSAEPEGPAPSLREGPHPQPPHEQTGPAGPGSRRQGASDQSPQPGAVPRAGPQPELCLRHPWGHRAEPSGKMLLRHCPPSPQVPSRSPVGALPVPTVTGRRGPGSEGRRPSPVWASGVRAPRPVLTAGLRRPELRATASRSGPAGRRLLRV